MITIYPFLDQCVKTETWLNVFSYLLFVLGIVSMLVEYLVEGFGAKGKSPRNTIPKASFSDRYKGPP